MKNYLENLKKELKKAKINDAEILEIIADHREMLSEAQEEGLSDEELIVKFGDPEKIARELKADLYNDNFSVKSEVVVGEGELEGYELFKSFPVMDALKKVSFKLISEDVVYFPYDGLSIQVYVKNMKNLEKYKIEYLNNEFSISKSKKGSISIFGSKSTPDFGVMVPFEQYLDLFNIENISGDYKIDNVNTKLLKVKTISGDIELSNIESVEATFSTVSGDIEVSGYKGNSMDISLVSGDCDLNNTKLQGELNINTVSGDVDIENFKGENIGFRTVSGDFDGNETYPNSVEVKSVSGDFEITNSNKEHYIEVKSKKTLSGDVTIN